MMAPTVVTKGTNSIYPLEQKNSSTILNSRFLSNLEKTSSDFALKGNSLLYDDKMLKSLENTMLKTKTSLGGVEKQKFSTKIDSIDLSAPTKFSCSFDLKNVNCGLTSGEILTKNKFLTNGLIENRLLNAKISSKFGETCSKIDLNTEKQFPSIFSSHLSVAAPFSIDQKQIVSGFDDKKFLSEDEKLVKIGNKRKIKPSESAIHEEIINLSSDSNEGAPSKRPKRSLVNELKEKKKILTDEIEENCKKKLQFVNCIAGSLISSPKFFSPVDETRREIITLADGLVDVDPEFILKVALYTRCDLNIRTTANFLLAYAADRPSCRKYLKKYFSASIRLPSDWIEVAELYASLKENKKSNKPCSLPNALRHVMVEKFADFDEYSLAKHNKNKKTNKGKKKTAEMAAKKLRQLPPSFDLIRFDSPPPDDETTTKTKGKKINLKKLIRQLHIEKPAQFVMAILGKKYPSDSLTFQRSGLLGIWNEERSGKRMKLAIPETWETQVASRGNKAEVWQDLLDHKKLPYMALLRNLRNIIKSGVDEKYHKMILSRLENEYAVVNSKQFPFRFFSAYHVLDQLVEEYKTKIEEMSKRGQNAVKLPTKAVKKGKVVEWWVRKKQKKLMQTSIHYDEILINRYRKSLDNAVRIATIRNVKPIRGRTIVYCNVNESMHITPCSSAKGLGKPRTVEEVGILLALMCTYVCEDSRLFLLADDQLEEANFNRGMILDNMSKILEQAEKLRSLARTGTSDLQSVFGFDDSSSSSADAFETSCQLRLSVSKDSTKKILETLRSYLIDRSKVDNILMITQNSGSLQDNGFETMITNFLYQYRRLVNDRTLYVNINLSANIGITKSDSESSNDDQKNVYLRGYSDQILRYVAERGSSDQLNHVENIDLAYDLLKKINKPELPFKIFMDESLLSTGSNIDSLPKVVRVFISSTFRDMQSERNILLRHVFPELQRRARSKFSIDIVPVDLRWGITESQAHSHSSVNLCLQQVSKCQLFIGLLGERYGYRLSNYERIVDERGRPYEWLKDYPPGASITELEIHKFALSNVDQSKNRSFFYFRDPKFMQDVPETYLNFMTEKNDPSAVSRLKDLKMKIHRSGFNLYENYPWKFDGIRDELPHLNGLQSLGKRVLDDLWAQITNLYENYEAKTAEGDEIRTQWNFVRSEAQKHVGRDKLMNLACGMLKRNSSGLFLLTSGGALGKTSFMAALAKTILYRQDVYGSPVVCFRDALIGRGEENSTDPVRILFKYLTICAGLSTSTIENEISPSTWSELLSKLNDCGYKLTFLLDGFDNCQIEWLFDAHYENVKFVVSVNDGSSLEESIGRRKLIHRKIELNEMDLADRAKMVQGVLTSYGKNLDEKTFNNQMRILLSKRGSSLPSYLLMACEQLRLFGTFENLNSILRCMSSNLTGLICDVLKKIEIDHERRLIELIICFVVSFDGGLTQTDLYQLTSLAVSYNRLDDLNLDEIYIKYQSGFIYEDFLPYSSFLNVFNCLSATFFNEIPTGKSGEVLLNIRFREISMVIKKYYVKNHKLLASLKVIFAGYLYFSCDPSCDETFQGVASRHFSQLPTALTNLNQIIRLFGVVTSEKYVEKCFLLSALVDFRRFYGVLLKHQEKSRSVYIDVQLINDMQKFVIEKCDFLYRYPSLMCQELKNQPKCSVLNNLSIDQRSESIKFVEWLNKPNEFSSCDRTLTIENVSSIAISAYNHFAAVGSNDGRVLLMDCSSAKAIHTFVGHCDAVSDVCFLDNEGSALASCTSGGAIFVWNTKLLTKIASLSGHSGNVAVCRPFKWGKVVDMISAGWDSTIRLWNYHKSKEIETIKDKILNSPINCLDCHPTDAKVVVGLWNSKLVVYNVAPIERKAVLRGHLSSVRAVAYHPNGLFIVSASMDGEVKLWSSVFASQIGSFKGHCCPVTKLTYSNETLITAAEDSLLKIWSPLLGVPVCDVPAPDGQLAATAVALKHDGTSFAVGFNSNKVTFWSLNATTREVHSVWASQLASSVQRLKFIPRKPLLFIVCRDEARIVSSDNGSVANVLQNDEGPMTGGDFFADVAVTTHTNGVICFYQNDEWWMDSGKKRARQTLVPRAVVHGHTGAVLDCAFNSIGDELASVGVDKNLFVWDVVSIMERTTITPNESKSLYNCHNDAISCCAWSDRKDVLVTGSNDCTLKVWASDTMELLTTFVLHKAPITDVAVKRGCIVSSSTDGTVAVWSAKGVLVTQLKDDSGACPFSVDLLLQPKAETKLWAEIVDEDEVDKAETVSKADKLTQGFGSINFDEAVILASFSNGVARVWKPFLGNAKSSLASHTTSVIGLASSTMNSTMFFSASQDGSCKFWTLPSVHVESSACFSLHSGAVQCAAACPGERYIVTGGRDGKCAVSMYNVDDEFVTFPFDGHSKSVTGIVWLSSGSLATSGEDGFVKFWTIDVENQRATFVNECKLEHPACVLTFDSQSSSLYVALWNGEVVEIRKNHVGAYETGKFAFFGKCIESLKVVNPSRFVVGTSARSDAGDEAYRLGESDDERFVWVPQVSFATSISIDNRFVVGCTDFGQLFCYDLSISNDSHGFRKWQAHSGRITFALTLKSPKEKFDEAIFCTVSHDRTLKIWKGSDLIGLWEAPTALNFVEFSETTNLFWCGDVLGCVYCLKFS